MTRVRLLLLAVFLGAIGLRLHGLAYLLPHNIEGDFSIVVQSQLLHAGAENPVDDPQFGKYPLLIARLEQLLPDQWAREKDPTPRALEAHLEDAIAPVLQVRRVVALIALVIVPATWLLARTFMGPWASLLAAFLAATSVLHLFMSQQARPHGASGPLVALAVVACLRLLKRGDILSYLLAGVAVALAMGALQSGFAVGFSIVAACLFVVRREGLTTAWRPLLPLAVILASLPLFYPFVLSDRPDAPGSQLEFVEGGIRQAGHFLQYRFFNGHGFLAIAESMWSFDTPIAILMPVGLLAWLLTRRRAGAWDKWRELAVVLAYVGPYILVIGMYQRTFERFVIPLLPFFICLAVYGLVQFGRFLEARLPRPAFRTAAAAGALAFVVVPGAMAAKFSYLRGKADTETEAAQYLVEHTEPGDRIYSLPLHLIPLLTTEEGVRVDRIFAPPHYPTFPYWWSYQFRMPESSKTGPRYSIFQIPIWSEKHRSHLNARPVEYLRSLRANWFVIEAYEQGRHHSELHAIHSALMRMKSAEHVARFSPDSDPGWTEMPMTHGGIVAVQNPHFYWRLFRARAYGPVVDVFRIRK